MAVIKSANMPEVARGAVVLDLGDLHRQGHALIEQAKARAAEIVAQAQAERARLIRDAADMGRAEGLARGLAEGRAAGAEEGRLASVAERREALDKLEAGLTTVLGHLASERERLLADARRDVIRLAASMAEKVTKRVITLDETVVVAQVEAVLGLVLRSSRLVLRVHPQDRALIAEAMPALLAAFQSVQHVEFEDDAALDRGSCVARVADSMGGQIDASVATQLDRIVEVVLPKSDAPPATGGAGSGGNQP